METHRTDGSPQSSTAPYRPPSDATERRPAVGVVARSALGKGQKERVIPLSPQLLAELRAYWVKVRPTRWLFPGNNKERQLCDSAALACLLQRAETDGAFY
jgi:integrase